MRSRYEIIETTTFVQASDGWHQVTITDTLTGDQAKGLAKSYEEALQRAWVKLKERALSKAA
jgi:hypothetical protein